MGIYNLDKNEFTSHDIKEQSAPLNSIQIDFQNIWSSRWRAPRARV